jgi:hypothetical protein
MNMTDAAMLALCEVMHDQCGAGAEFELALGELVGRYRRAHDARMRDAEAARLLPLGAEVVAIRQTCHRSTAYRRAARDLLSRLERANATTA